MDSFKELIAKYGLSVVLMIVLMVIGVALYLWKREEDSKDAKMISTAGVAIAITGGFVGLGTIAYNAMQEKDSKGSGNGGGSGGGGGSSNGEDSFPGGG
jgi:uncharacterized membrane protein YgcG